MRVYLDSGNKLKNWVQEIDISQRKKILAESLEQLCIYLKGSIQKQAEHMYSISSTNKMACFF